MSHIIGFIGCTKHHSYCNGKTGWIVQTKELRQRRKSWSSWNLTEWVRLRLTRWQNCSKKNQSWTQCQDSHFKWMKSRKETATIQSNLYKCLLYRAFGMQVQIPLMKMQYQHIKAADDFKYFVQILEIIRHYYAKFCIFSVFPPQFHYNVSVKEY